MNINAMNIMNIMIMIMHSLLMHCSKVDPQVFRSGFKCKHLVGSTPRFMHCSCTAHALLIVLIVLMVDGAHG
jgi:hypothetical protein